MAISWNSRRIILTGTLVGGYRIVAEPIRGGFAAVYRGEALCDGRSVAIKVLDDLVRGGRRAVARFAQEVELVRRIEHPNIVAIEDQGVLDDGRPYYVMEWIDGCSLEDELRARGPLAPIDALPILEQLCAALSAAHQAGVAHRDLKPANIMVQTDDDRTVVKLLDFGIAKAVGAHDAEPGLTTTGISLGTVHYMAPEQLMCRAIDASVDVYALGVLIHRMVTGVLPFDAPTRMVVQMMHLDDPPPRASDRAPRAAPWDQVIQWCMGKRPAERPSSVDELLRSLRQALTAHHSAPNLDTQIWLQLELAGSVASRAESNARTAAIVRGNSWMRASGWDIIAESDNAVLGGRSLDVAPGAVPTRVPPAFMDGAHRFVEVFGWRKIPWTVTAGLYTHPSDASSYPSRGIARAWLWSSENAPPPVGRATMLPSGVYVSRSLVFPPRQHNNNNNVNLSNFVFIQR